MHMTNWQVLNDIAPYLNKKKAKQNKQYWAVSRKINQICQYLMCGSGKYPYPPPPNGWSMEILGGGGAKG